MPVEISAGNLNLAFLQVTRVKIHTPAKCEASVLRVMAQMIDLIHVFLDVVPKTLTKINACCH